MAQSGREVAPDQVRSGQFRRRPVGADDAARPVDHHQRIGQCFQQPVGGRALGGQSVVLFLPAPRQPADRDRQARHRRRMQL